MAAKQEQPSSGDDDRLSSLHDSLLTRILSFLPTLDAIRTSILSKTWRSLWTALPDLHLYIAHYRFPGRLVGGRNKADLLRRLLHLRGGRASDIRTFTLTSEDCMCRACSRQVDEAIAYATSHGVRHLTIELDTSRGDYHACLDSAATRSILSCASLESLELVGVGLHRRRVPPSSTMPSLRALRLTLTPEGGGGGMFGDLISLCPSLTSLRLASFRSFDPCQLHSSTTKAVLGCPALESLELINVRLELGPRGFLDSVCLGKLRSLHIEDVLRDGTMDDAIISSCPLLEELACSEWQHPSVIDMPAPHLRTLKVSGRCFGSPLELTPSTIDNIFDCSSLESLGLRHLRAPERLQSIRLSSLRALHIGQLSGIRDSLLGEIISNCPILESLWLADLDVEALNISAPNLKRLHLQRLDVADLSISCTRLLLFFLQQCQPVNKFRVDMPALVRASVSSSKNASYYATIVERIISCCPVLEELTLSTHCIPIINISAPNLKTLSLHIRRTSVIRIACPMLELFKFELFDPLEEFQAYMPSSVMAYITLPSNKSGNGAYIRQILRSVHKAKYLRCRPLHTQA